MKKRRLQVSTKIIKQMLLPGGLLFPCRREDVLEKGASFYITISDDGKMLLLIQIIGSLEETIMFVYWEGIFNKYINPWTGIISSNSPGEQKEILLVETYLPVEKLSKRKSLHLHEWGPKAVV